MERGANKDGGVEGHKIKIVIPTKMIIANTT